MPINANFLSPVLALISWTAIMWVWLYATRIPAMKAARIEPNTARHPGSGWNEKMPAAARGIADNYNHLHEQPTIFYALMFYLALTGGSDSIAAGIAWAYVVLRIVHSLVQAVVGDVMLRFGVFVLASLTLFALLAKALLGVPA